MNTRPQVAPASGCAPTTRAYYRTSTRRPTELAPPNNPWMKSADSCAAGPTGEMRKRGGFQDIQTCKGTKEPTAWQKTVRIRWGRERLAQKPFQLPPRQFP